MTTLQILKLSGVIKKCATTTEPTAISIDGYTVDIKMKAGLGNAESGYMTVWVNGVEVFSPFINDGEITENGLAYVIDRVALKIANIKLFGE